MITDIMGEKRIVLGYPIQGKEVAVVSDNIRYEFTEPWTIEFKSRDKQIVA